MKAIVRQQYGSPDVLALADVDRPVPVDGEVLVEVRAASVNPYDWHMMAGTPYLVRLNAGLRQPRNKQLGSDVAGRVVAVGPGVTRFQPGDEVFGLADGAYAEYVRLPAANAAVKPANVTFEQAAAAPMAAVTALQGLRDKAKVQAGQRVLVNGASGGVGTFAVQIAKACDAHVTGVCGTGNVELVRSIGADDVIDHTATDFLRDGRSYDVIVDMMGTRPVLELRRSVSPQGTYVAIGAPKDGQWAPLLFLVKVLTVSLVGNRKMMPMLAHVDAASLDAVRALLEGGKVAPVIDRTFPLDATADALRYVGQGHARGKVVICV